MAYAVHISMYHTAVVARRQRCSRSGEVTIRGSHFVQLSTSPNRTPLRISFAAIRVALFIGSQTHTLAFLAASQSIVCSATCMTSFANPSRSKTASFGKDGAERRAQLLVRHTHEGTRWNCRRMHALISTRTKACRPSFRQLVRNKPTEVCDALAVRGTVQLLLH